MAISPKNPRLAELERLALAYPYRKTSAEVLRVYAEHLFDVPVWLLHRAVERQVSTSPWFPSVSVLRELCAGIAGTQRFDLLPALPEDNLAAAALELEERFYRLGELDEAEWERLARACETAGRTARGDFVREKLERLRLVREGTALQAWLARSPNLAGMLEALQAEQAEDRAEGAGMPQAALAAR